MNKFAKTTRRIGYRLLSDGVTRVVAPAGLPSPFRGSPHSALRAWLSDTRDLRPPEDAPRIAVHVLRNQYWAEWAGFVCCRVWLDGYQPVLTFASTELNQFMRGRPVLDPDPEKYWRELVHCARFLPTDLDRWPQRTGHGTDTVDEGLVAGARISLAYDGRPDTTADVDELTSELRRYIAAYRDLMSQHRISRCICPSGLIGTSAAVLRACQDEGIPVVTVEGWGLRSQHMTWNTDAPALHFDISAWMDALGALEPGQEALIDEYVRLQEEPRSTAGRFWSGYRMAQRFRVDADLPERVRAFVYDDSRPLLLLGTNVVGDSVTLGRNTIFEDQLEWIGATVEWARKNDNAKVLIRVHPEEQMHVWAQPLGEEVRRRVEGISNVLVVQPQDEVNTFALVRRAACGSVWVSNLGADMVARNVPTILAAKPHYHNVGIGLQPNDQDEFFALLQRATTGDLEVAADERDRARRYIYVFTRLVSMRGNPLTGVLQRPLPRELDGEVDFFFRILKGEASRTEVVARERRRVTESDPESTAPSQRSAHETLSAG